MTTLAPVICENPTLHIVNGPGQRDLELAFVGRNLEATARFTIYIHEGRLGPTEVSFEILNFAFVTCHGPNYKLGGKLWTTTAIKERLPRFNFIFIEYNAERKDGKMEFSNAE